MASKREKIPTIVAETDNKRFGVHTLRVANRTNIQRAFGVSSTAVGQWITRGMPVLGTEGKEVFLDIAAVAVWLHERDRARQAPGPDVDPEELRPRDRLDHYNAELKRRELQRVDGELIRVEDLRAASSEALKGLAAALENVPTELERKCSLDGRAVAIVEEHVHGMRQALLDRLEEILGKYDVRTSE